MNGLVELSQQSLDQAQDLAELKQEVAPLLAKMASLTERLKMTEEREQALQERLSYSKNQLEAVFETTQDYRRRLDDQTQRMLLDPLTKFTTEQHLTIVLSSNTVVGFALNKIYEWYCLMSITSKP